MTNCPTVTKQWVNILTELYSRHKWRETSSLSDRTGQEVFITKMKTQLSCEKGFHTSPSSKQAGEHLIIELDASMAGSSTCSTWHLAYWAPNCRNILEHVLNFLWDQWNWCFLFLSHVLIFCFKFVCYSLIFCLTIFMSCLDWSLVLSLIFDNGFLFTVPVSRMKEYDNYCCQKTPWC